MNSVLSNKCLLLNKSWAPLRIITLRKALTLVFKEAAMIIDYPSYQEFTWDDWSQLRPKATDEAICAGRIFLRVPEIVKVLRYDRIPQPKQTFSRRTLYKRDHMTCQYCGRKPPPDEWTIDHVLPVSQGGKTTFENCVLACYSCNSKKANRTPEQAHMKLLTVPKAPSLNAFRGELVKPIKSWQAFISEAYWNVPLKDE